MNKQSDSPCYVFVRKFARPVRNRHLHLILDGFDNEWYLEFDFDEDPETPAAKGTCDILAVPVGELPGRGMRIIADATEYNVKRFMFALGASRFSDETRKVLYEATSVIRTAAEDPHP